MAALRQGTPGGISVPNGANGAPPPGAAEQFGAYENAVTASPWQRPMRSNRGALDAVNTNNFPARYFTPNPYDDYYDLKSKALINLYPDGARDRIHTMLTDQDLAYLDNKRKQQELAKFTVWTEQWFDFSDPAQADLYAKAFPEYYEKRKQLITDLAQIQVKYAILRLLGPRTREDFLFLWGVKTGRIPLINGPLWNPTQWGAEGPEKRLAIFNPWRSYNETAKVPLPNADNRTDPEGGEGFSYLGHLTGAAFGGNENPADAENYQGFLFKGRVNDFAQAGRAALPAIDANQNVQQAFRAAYAAERPAYYGGINIGGGAVVPNFYGN